MDRPIDLRRYGTVEQRIRAFYERFPDGAIQTDLVRLEPDFVLFRARVFRDRHDPAPTTGWAYDRPPGDDEAAARQVVASCEAAAVGRALANLGLAGPVPPSREEMEKVVRLRAASGHGGGSAPPDRGAPPVPPMRRLRELLAGLPLPVERRRRIEARLQQGLTDREANELEAYLLALRSGGQVRRRGGVDGRRARR